MLRGFAASTVVAAALLATACAPESELPVYRQIEELRLETSLGGELTEEDLEGRIHVVDFVFTSCPLACPMMTARLQRIYEEHADSADVRFLSVTTDPLRDTVAVLHDFAAERGIDQERWLFGRAEPAEVARLSEKEFLLGASGFPAGHSLKFVLVDRNRQIRGYYDSEDDADLAALRVDLRRLQEAD